MVLWSVVLSVVVIAAYFVNSAPVIDDGDIDGVKLRHGKNHPHALLLRNAQNYSICPFQVVESRIEGRVPAVLENVYCLQNDCTCTDDKQFKCIQLYTQVEVFYTGNGTRASIPLYYGCICADQKSLKGLTNEVPKFAA